MKKIGLLVLMLCLSISMFADNPKNPPGSTYKVVGKDARGCDVWGWKVGCVAGSIPLGNSRPGSKIESSRLRLYEEAPSPVLYTPQSLTFVGNWSMQSVSTDRTEAGAPRTVCMFDPDGDPIRYDFEDDESMGLPDDHLFDERRFTRLFMVDAEGWATLSEPAYYDLYTHDGDLYRFYAYPSSEHYLELCYYKTAAGYEEALEDIGVELIKSSGGILRQVRTATRLADVVIESISKYRVDCYADADVGDMDANGVYTVEDEAEPFESWVIENPNPGNFEGLRVTKISGSYSNVMNYTYSDDSEEWTMTKGDGCQKVVRGSEWNDHHRVALELLTYYGGSVGAYHVVRKSTQRSEVRPFGRVITEKKRYFAPDIGSGTPLTTKYEYHSVPSDIHQYGQLSRIEGPAGYCTEYRYEDSAGRKTEETTHYKDSGAESGTRFDYDPHTSPMAGPVYDARPRTVENWVKTVDGKKLYFSRIMNDFQEDSFGTYIHVSERAPDPLTPFGGAGNLRTINGYYGGSGVYEYLKGRKKEVKRPDGTMDSYVYERGDYTANANPVLSSFTPCSTGNAWRTTIVAGTTNSPAGIACRTTKQVLVEDKFGNKVLEETLVYTGGTNYEHIAWSAREFDIQGNALETYWSDGRNESAQWDSSCCGKTSETDAWGVEKAFTYDLLQRVESIVQLDVDGSTPDVIANFEYDAVGRLLSSTLSDSTLTNSLSVSNQYDLAGRKISSVDPAGLVTEYEHQNGGRTVDETLPGGADKIVDNYIDGRIKSVAGDGVVPKFHDYGVYEDRTTWEMEYVGTTNSPQWKRTVKDGADRIIRIEKPAYGGGFLTTRYHYNPKGQLERIERPEQADILYAYTEEGLRYRTALDMNKNRTIDLSGPDRVSETDAYYEEDGSGDFWRVKVSKLYAEESSANVTTSSVKKVRLTGLGSPSAIGNLQSEIIMTDIRGNDTITKKYIDRGGKTVTDVIDVPDSTNDMVTITINGLVQSKTTKTGLTYTYQYDSLNRLAGVTDPRTGEITLRYNSKGQVDWVEDAASNKTWFAYDYETGRKVFEVDQLVNVTTYTYNDHGQITVVGGETKYPVEYGYDTYGRLDALYTQRGASNDWDITRWNYDDRTGLVTNKLYDDGNGPSYAYTPDGKLAKRTWARGIATDYRYNLAGSLTNIVYSDSTPSIALQYNRLGQKAQVVDATGTNTFTYSDTFQLTNETQLVDYDLARVYDDLGRAAGISLGDDYAVSYAFDELGRFTSVSSAMDSVSSVFDYSYLENSDLLSGYTNNFGFAVEYDFEPNRNLKTEVLNQFGTNMISSFDYLHNELGRRSQRTDLRPLGLGLSTNLFTYNDRSELIGAEMGTNSYDYAYDNIGNRTTSTNNSQLTTYSANKLNQYFQITNNQSQVALSYDSDGNLTNDAMNVYTWNGENRLVVIEPLSPTNNSTKLEFSYDYMGRRISKSVSTYSSDLWSPTSDHRFVYDDWNLISDVCSPTSGSSSTNCFVWGLDLSQTLQGAGGIGGLLSASLAMTNQQQATVFYSYDGGGNITELVDINGTVQTHYEYDSYGKLLAAVGDLHALNPFKFSTKYYDVETDFYYYGYRYYSAKFGRWIKRDSIGEVGGFNLYAFVMNSPINWCDLLGWKLTCKTGTAQKLLDDLKKNGSATDKANIEKLENSDKKHTITTRNSTFGGQSTSTPSDDKAAHTPGEGSGSSIKIELNSQSGHSTGSTLSHEVQHSADMDSGSMTYGDNDGNGYDDNEDRAVDTQREYQSKNGEKLRVDYGDRG